MSDYNKPGMGCPFDYRLARTPYFVLPKLALRSMPLAWRRRFEAMLQEMDDTGMSTPGYHVFRDDGPGEEYTRATCVNEQTGFVRIVRGKDDPWANYRYGDVSDLCPDFKRPEPTKVVKIDENGYPGELDIGEVIAFNEPTGVYEINSMKNGPVFVHKNRVTFYD